MKWRCHARLVLFAATHAACAGPLDPPTPTGTTALPAMNAMNAGSWVHSNRHLAGLFQYYRHVCDVRAGNRN